MSLPEAGVLEGLSTNLAARDTCNWTADVFIICYGSKQLESVLPTLAIFKVEWARLRTDSSKLKLFDGFYFERLFIISCHVIFSSGYWSWESFIKEFDSSSENVFKAREFFDVNPFIVLWNLLEVFRVGLRKPDCVSACLGFILSFTSIKPGRN